MAAEVTESNKLLRGKKFKMNVALIFHCTATEQLFGTYLFHIRDLDGGEREQQSAVENES